MNINEIKLGIDMLKWYISLNDNEFIRLNSSNLKDTTVNTINKLLGDTAKAEEPNSVDKSEKKKIEELSQKKPNRETLKFLAEYKGGYLDKNKYIERIPENEEGLELKP